MKTTAIVVILALAGAAHASVIPDLEVVGVDSLAADAPSLDGLVDVDDVAALATSAARTAATPSALASDGPVADRVAVVTHAAPTATSATWSYAGSLVDLLPDGLLRFDATGLYPSLPGSSGLVLNERLSQLDAIALVDATPTRITRDDASAQSAAPTVATRGVAVPAAPSNADAPLAAAVAAAIWGGLCTMLGVALYSRMQSGGDALANDTRRGIYELICASPGITIQKLSNGSHVSYSTASYHLDRLSAARLVVVTRDGNKMRYYRNGGAFSEQERAVLPLLKSAETVAVIDALLASPGTYRARLADALGVSTTTVSWHLKRLRSAGLLEETKDGRQSRLALRDVQWREVMDALALKLAAAETAEAERARAYACA